MKPSFLSTMAGVQARTWLRRMQGVGNESRLMVAVLALFVLGYLILGYVLLYHGLSFIHGFPGVGTLLAKRILFLIFAFFFFMLVFSNVIIGYSSLFRGAETMWLLTLPVRRTDVYRWKCIESLVVSSWALLFLSAPLMAAYGHVLGAPPWFYVQVALGSIPFVVVPAVVASWTLLVTARLLTQRWFKWMLIALGAGMIAWILWNVRPVLLSEDTLTPESASFDTLLRHTRLSLNPLLPSGWLAKSLFAWVEGFPGQAVFYFLVLLSNALFGILLTSQIAGRFFFRSWLACADGRAWQRQMLADERRRAPTRKCLPERLARMIPGLSAPARALLVKDSLLFWRDPTQWSQFAIFFGLLAIYIVNLRNVALDFRTPFWAMLISFLNLSASALTLSTLTTRFVFPQFSLEGRRLWIVGMSPLGLHRVITLKFWSSATFSLLLTLTLMVTSSIMLRLPPEQTAIFGGTIALMSLALSGLAVGLGTLFPNLREENPSKIVSGFGGTLCLVLSFVYILLVISVLAVPAGLELSRDKLMGLEAWQLRIVSSVIVVALSALTAILPMRLARKKLKNMEF